MGDLRSRIAHLRSLTPELNAATDRATRLVQAVEHFLDEECRLGIPAYVEINTEDSNNGQFRSGNRLEYARWEGKFRLLVSDFWEDANDPEGPNITDRLPWVNCTRDRKLATIYGIPHLLDRIAKRVESTIRDANETSSTVESYLADLGVVVKEGK